MARARRSRFRGNVIPCTCQRRCFRPQESGRAVPFGEEYSRTSTPYIWQDHRLKKRAPSTRALNSWVCTPTSRRKTFSNGREGVLCRRCTLGIAPFSQSPIKSVILGNNDHIGHWVGCWEGEQVIPPWGFGSRSEPRRDCWRSGLDRRLRRGERSSPTTSRTSRRWISSPYGR